MNISAKVETFTAEEAEAVVKGVSAETLLQIGEDR
jgi:hypothetical protein